ncbi:hypothetical protein CYMTET_41457 [Cymbomonas tetramitiformis]|uniref:Uncharacterized protein n=1 Tax=Cymbomonas tetramitiformis TaxID=36881 RepID=A0AAE0C650_9CHLO|nr:hypothetical protein CYMTET_41457 [Cymbomonas tetramitiformis]
MTQSERRGTPARITWGGGAQGDLGWRVAGAGGMTPVGMLKEMAESRKEKSQRLAQVQRSVGSTLVQAVAGPQCQGFMSTTAAAKIRSSQVLKEFTRFQLQLMIFSTG